MDVPKAQNHIRRIRWDDVVVISAEPDDMDLAIYTAIRIEFRSRAAIFELR